MITKRDAAYVTDCRHCQTVFEFNEQDADWVVKEKHSDNVWVRISCPTCKEPVALPRGHLERTTPAMRDRLLAVESR